MNSEVPESQIQEDKPSGRAGFDYRMTHHEINDLDLSAYDGPVMLVNSPERLPDAVAALSADRILGFDTETRPSFTKGTNYKPALLQLAGEQVVCIFQLKLIGLPRPLIDILANPEVIKAGVAPQRDALELKALAEFEPAGMFDVSEAGRMGGIQNLGLKGLAAVLLGERISKRAQLTNWARQKLSPHQITYAATDAWISRRIYLRLQEMDMLRQPVRKMEKES
ncbi:MAG TPA: 3'-5' exonuclease [Kiritimatiellia bacterium]|nr:3'-5' exonuclease domain-containing protein 2 [Kiritimatiellia bacterium]HNR93712.1 3'-5' exonuclease [Kiritimatiellia bacterium]HNS81130.1 3'-5' exonuclease [Kiritimatiellia bacterium]HPA77693.1 3'-5' exonuclease [Kiritimatiellia bacterium]HQQ03756.1 3'-5' exonuclease [Kiritimatiellia bacterium]